MSTHWYARCRGYDSILAKDENRSLSGDRDRWQMISGKGSTSTPPAHVDWPNAPTYRVGDTLAFDEMTIESEKYWIDEPPVARVDPRSK